MARLPTEYREFAEKIGEILRKKPKKGYFENMLESSEPEPLDPLEQVSSSIIGGDKQGAIRILEQAQSDPAKKAQLQYLDEADSLLRDLLADLHNLPERETPASSNSQAQSLTLPIIGMAIVLIVAATSITYFIL